MKKLLIPVLFLAIVAGFSACASSSSKNQNEKVPNNEAVNVFAGHENDAVRFAEIYPVSENNPFIIANFEEITAFLKYGTGVIVFGFPICPRCKNAFPVLEKAFREMNMERYAGFRGKILYYDMYDDREENNERYQTLVEYTKKFLPTDENGNPRIYSPDVFFLTAGKIVGNHLDTVPSLKNPRDLLNDEQKAELLEIYMDLIEKVEECGC